MNAAWPGSINHVAKRQYGIATQGHDLTRTRTFNGQRVFENGIHMGKIVGRGL